MYQLLKEIEIKESGNSLIIIGVNKEAANFIIISGGILPIYNSDIYTLEYKRNLYPNYHDDRVIIDYNFNNNCKVLGKLSELHDITVKPFVNSFLSDKTKSGVVYENYFNARVITYEFESPLDSFRTLLKKHNCYTKDHYDEPKPADYLSIQELSDNFLDEYSDWRMLPDDLLIIYKENIK